MNNYMYVITAGEPVLNHLSGGGVYCKFLKDFQELVSSGYWSCCTWGKLKNATIFSSYSQAEPLIKNYEVWVKLVKAEITLINPLNLCM